MLNDIFDVIPESPTPTRLVKTTKWAVCATTQTPRDAWRTVGPHRQKQRQKSTGQQCAIAVKKRHVDWQIHVFAVKKEN